MQTGRDAFPHRAPVRPSERKQSNFVTIMITIEDLYAKTQNGLDIIFYYYPQARECHSGHAKHFRIRAEDHTPSATLKEIKGVWRVTDFGGDGRAMSPIDVCMQESNLSFTEAIYFLAREFNVDGKGISPAVNRPEFRNRAATEDEPEGHFVFELNEHPSDDELALLGPRVKREDCDALGYSSLKQYTSTRKGKTTTVIANENYPIFIRKSPFRDGDGKTVSHFYKVYQPLNPDKAFRFFYHGNKPQKYINGLFELEGAYREHNKKRERDMRNSGELGEDADYKYEKLPEAFIASGERDALCVHAHGYHPLWFNSESYNLSESEYREIAKYVEKIYNIPDLDETGVRRGIELARRFYDIYLVWLPDRLRTYRDRRGKPRKDFRDFCEIWPERERFRELLNLAMPFRFWEYRRNEKGLARVELISDYAMHFLRCNGFHCLEDKNAKTGKMFVHVDRHIVREVRAKDLRAYFRQFVRSRYLDINIRDLVNNTTRLSETALENLDEITIDFCNHTPGSQYFFFRNAVWEATGEKIVEHDPTKVKHHVWEDELIDRQVTRLDGAFTVKKTEGDDGPGLWDIEIPETVQSNFFKYLINASRIFWRQELEYEGPRMTAAEHAEYRQNYKFAIDGPLLSEEEIAEQKQHLINKIFALGYLLHHYKAENRAWCVYAMDNKEGSIEESNGGTGKSFCFKTPRLFMQSVTLSGRNPKLTENKHIFENVTEHSRYILVDDADQYTPFGFFFDIVTGDITVNPKNTKSYAIPFEKSPKFCITSNYVLRNIDPSTSRRILYAVFSDYYHEKTSENDYRETRTIYDDFGKNLFRESYTEAEWNADINFLVECCRFYLSVVASGVKIQPPMKNVIRRNLRGIMGEAFLEWAQVYFSLNGGNCDRLIPRDVVFNDFKENTGKRNATAQYFSRALKAYCEYEPSIIALDPVEMQNSQKRIIRKVEGKSTAMFYVQTRSALNAGGYESVDDMPADDGDTGLNEVIPDKALPF
jgi:hypothetical protein